MSEDCNCGTPPQSQCNPQSVCLPPCPSAEVIAGPAGADGKSWYPCIRYADDAFGTGFSANPEGKGYISIRNTAVANILDPAASCSNLASDYAPFWKYASDETPVVGGKILVYAETPDWDPAAPYTTALNALTGGASALPICTWSLPTAQYLIRLTLQMAWNAGSSGANVKNGTFVFKDGASTRKTYKWARSKGGDEGDGTNSTIVIFFKAALTNGNVLTCQGADDAILLKATLEVIDPTDVTDLTGT